MKVWFRPDQGCLEIFASLFALAFWILYSRPNGLKHFRKKKKNPEQGEGWWGQCGETVRCCQQLMSRNTYTFIPQNSKMEKGGEMVMAFVSTLELMFCFPFSVSPDSCACNFVSPDTFLGNFLSRDTCACNFLSHLDSAWTTDYPAP